MAGRPHIGELDGIRGIACLLVLVEHCFVAIAAPAKGSAVYEAKIGVEPFLLGGVDLFFVLSGFLIGGILLDAKRAGTSDYFSSFWVRRAARILPALYLLLAGYWIAVILSARFNWLTLDQWLLCPPHHDLWEYATFLQSIPMAMHGQWSAGPYWLRPTWSLAVEEQFYLLFPLVVYFLRRRTVAVLMLGAIVVEPILRVVVHHGWNSWAADILLPCRSDGLAAGVLVAMAVREPAAMAVARKLRPLTDVVLIAGVAGIISGFWLFRNLAAVYSTMAVVFAIAILRVFLVDDGPYRKALRARPLAAVGLISYSLYLYHQPVLGILHATLLNDIPRLATAVQFGVDVLAMVVSIGLATASYFLMERPIRQAARRWIARRRALQESAAPA